MALISKTHTFSAGATIVASEHNTNYDTIYNDYNGNITNANISGSAAIAASKLDLSSIVSTMAFSAAALNTAKGSDIASATTTDIGAATGNYVHVTGTTTITGFGTVASGTWRIVRFTGALTLTHHATSLILPTAANITTAADDHALMVSLGSGNWICASYQRKANIDGVTAASGAEVLTGTEAGKYVAPSTMISHQGVVKGWCNLDGTGTIAADDSFNVSGVVDDGTGLYTITWDTDFSSTNYVVASNATSNQTAIAAIAAGSVQISCTISDGTASDVDPLCVIAIGDR